MTTLKRMFPTILAVVGVLCVILAVLLVALAVPKSSLGYQKVIGWISAVLLVILALLIAYYLFLGRDTYPNFFLFDRTKKKNIPVENLTFPLINERMTFFFTLICDSYGQLWQADLLEDDRKFGARRVYRPLVAYKMLYELGDKNQQEYWDCLFNASPETISTLCAILEKVGEKEMVKAFRYILDNYRDDEKKIKDFIRGNMRYIAGRMKTYIKTHIEWFY